MSSASIKKIIPCKKDQLIKMVLDIEKYPEFVPWCIEGKIYDKNESEDLISFLCAESFGLFKTIEASIIPIEIF